MTTALNILLLEDRVTDAELTLHAVRRAGFDPAWVRVETEKEFLAKLEDRFDIILADYQMPQFTALRALEILKQRNRYIPFIIVSGTIGEETAVEAIKMGASDYLLKDRLARLGNAIQLAIDQKKLKEEKQLITQALVQAESKFRRIFENSLDGIYQSFPNGGYITANPALAQMFGYETPEELIATVSDIGKQLYVHPEERIRFGSLLQKNNIVTNFETQIRRRNGEVIWISEQARAERDEKGGIIYFEGFVQNITERQLAEEKLMRAQKMEAVGRLAGGVAHDFNNLLTVVGIVSELIKDEVRDNSVVLDYMSEIDRATHQAALLTRQLLAFGRKQIMESKVFDLGELIQNIQKMLSRVIGEDIKFNTVIHPGPHRIKADSGQIEQVILNLIVNARDAMPQGGKLIMELSSVTIDSSYAKSHSDAQAGAYELLSVKDSGVGMSDDIITHIFEPFFTTKEAGRGTGLGLATSFGIIRQSGGFISVVSKPSQGSTFNVYLPTVADRASSQNNHTEPDVRMVGTETILLVEDDSALRKLSTIILERRGFKVVSASDGADALRILERQADNIDLLVTDAVMPNIGGRELIEKAQLLWPNLKFLLCSGYSNYISGNMDIESIALPYLQKPYTPEQLTQKIRFLLDQDA